MIRHHAGRLGNAVLLLFLAVKCTNDPDPVQPFPHEVILFITEPVADLPQWLYSPADGEHHQSDHRHCQQNDKRQRAIHGKCQRHATEKQHRNGDDVAGKHIGDPRQRSDIVGRAGKQRRGADAADFLEGEGVDPAKDHCAQIGTERRPHGCGTRYLLSPTPMK